MKFILGKKLEMTQMFDEKGDVVPVTLIEAGPCFILQVKTKEKDGYEAIQIGYEKILKEKNIKRPQKKKPYRYVKEARTEGHDVKEGDEINTSIFKEGERVAVAGISKGKGFAGAVKKWHFRGRCSTHGTKHEERSLGSRGSRFPQRTTPGRKGPGRMGTQRVTVKNLKIIKSDAEKNILVLKGAVPGRRGTLLEIKGLI
ncbi:MAG: 50S ribosomal protein L3 [bacterium]|nr:50S ribosomal protein L3 [bacterium]